MKSWKFRALLLAAPVVWCQQPAAKPAFEVASIKAAQPSPMGRIRVMMNADAEMLRYTNVSLKDCLRIAYRVKEFQIQGPDSLDKRYDIAAKIPAGVSQDQVPEMLQSMLEERFKLKLHRDTKEHAVYALVAAKDGPKLKPAEVQMGTPAAPGPGMVVRPMAGGPSGPPRNAVMMQVDGAGAHLKAPSATLGNLADMISRFTERPVIDATGISGQYDFDLVFSPESMRGMPGGMRVGPGPGPGDGPPRAAESAAEPAGSIYDSVKAYGLRLDPRKAPMEILIIDHIESEPTEN